VKGGMIMKFFYRGKSLEELQKMSMNEFSLLVDARARRYLKRVPADYRKLLKKIEKFGGKKTIKTRCRSAVILPSWVGLSFAVHNGKFYKEIKITPEMIGRRLGEFAHTTGRVLHSGPGVGATRGSKFLPLK
jgi:small subunit ribosomal protein S19